MKLPVCTSQETPFQMQHSLPIQEANWSEGSVRLCLTLNRPFLSLSIHLTLASVVFVRGREAVLIASTETSRGRD